MPKSDSGGCGDDFGEFQDDFGECGGFDLDQNNFAQIGEQTKENQPSCNNEQSQSIPEKPISLSTVRHTCEKFIGDVLCAIESFPDRAKELDDYVKELNKKFNQRVNCDVDQVLSFHLSSPLKRTLVQKQVRRSPKKAKK